MTRIPFPRSPGPSRAAAVRRPRNLDFVGAPTSPRFEIKSHTRSSPLPLLTWSSGPRLPGGEFETQDQAASFTHADALQGLLSLSQTAPEETDQYAPSTWHQGARSPRSDEGGDRHTRQVSCPCHRTAPVRWPSSSLCQVGSIAARDTVIVTAKNTCSIQKHPFGQADFLNLKSF